MITLKAREDYNSKYAPAGTKKAYIARITGRDSKMTFAREFIGKTSADVDEPGLYATRDVDKKGRAGDEEYTLILEVGGELEEFSADKEDAMKIAKALDAGRRIEQIVEYVEADAECAALHAEVLAVSKTLITVGSPDWIGQARRAGVPIGPDATAEQAAEILAQHQAASRQRMENAADRRNALMAGTDKYIESGWRLVTPKQAEAAVVAKTIDTATDACWQILQALPEKEAKKVLAALRVRLTPPKPATLLGMDEQTPAGVVTDAHLDAGTPPDQLGLTPTPVIES